MLENVIMESIVGTLADQHKLYFEEAYNNAVRYELADDNIIRVGHIVMQSHNTISIATNCFTAEGYKDHRFIDGKSHVCVKTYEVASPDFNPGELVMIISDWICHGINRLNNQVL